MTDVDRLKAWMDTNNYDSASLSKELGYLGDWIANVINGCRPIGYSLKWRFGEAFGESAFNQVFTNHYTDYAWKHQNRFPDQGLAQIAVSNAIRTGLLPHSSTQKCHGCDKQGQHYHHESYLPQDRLCVVPLCRSCHQRHHSGRARLTFGVVPTSVGVVRIAIAGLE